LNQSIIRKSPEYAIFLRKPQVAGEARADKQVVWDKPQTYQRFTGMEVFWGAILAEEAPGTESIMIESNPLFAGV